MAGLVYGHLTLSIIHQIYIMYGFLGEPKRVVNAEIWREGMSIHILVAYPGDLRCSLDWHFLSHLKNYREEYNFYGNFEGGENTSPPIGSTSVNHQITGPTDSL